MTKISIIVPVYNTSKYLSKCLSSLCNQNVDKSLYEIVVVNDGSTDDSQEIIKEFKNKYPSLIEYISKKNGGLSSARNAGIKASKGEYLIFVDSDDYVEKNLLSSFLSKNIECDLFIYGYNIVYENSTKVDKQCLGKDLNLNSNRALSYIIEKAAVRGYAWNKIFKRSIIEENTLLFDEQIKYIEDLIFVVHYLFECKNVYFSSEIFYNYVQREGSLINSAFNKSKLTCLKGYEEVLKLVSINVPEYIPTIKYFMFELYYELSVRMRLSANYQDYVEDYKMLKDKMHEIFKSFIWKNVRFKYKIKAIIKCYFYNLLLLRFRGKNEKN